MVTAAQKEPKKEYQDNLPTMKKRVEETQLGFRENHENFHRWRYFVFKTAIDQTTKAKLDALQKPDSEFNVIEAYLSRLRGEFAKQKPSILVSSGDEMPVNIQVIEAVQGHMLAILSEANNSQFEYDVYTDLLAGGYSAIKVWTEYSNERSFNQDIKLGRVYDPTLCGFDPMARLPHKGDGRFCYELFPKSKKEFEEEYPHIDLKKLKFNDSGNFRWCYKTSDKEEVVMICDYYEKKKKKATLMLLSDGSSVLESEYNEMVEKWMQNGGQDGQMALPPIVIDKRETELQTICRYRFIANKVIEYKETKFNEFPLIFVDGNSVFIKRNIADVVKQFTRPYFYHAIGAQRLKNACGQSLGSEIENISQVKLNVALEALPENDTYLKAYTNPQSAAVRVYNAFLKGNTATPIPPPFDVPRQPIPPEIVNTFVTSDQTIQNILGSYDASLGINDNQLSGIAVIEAATQSNAAAMPYVVGFLQGLNQAAQIIVDQMPKCHILPRSIPIADKEDNSKMNYLKINGKLPDGSDDPNSIRFNYKPNALTVKVEAGTNFAVQKSRSLQQIGVMMGASQTYAQFINAKCLKVLIKNMEVHAADQLEEKADEFMAEMAQQQKTQMEMQQLQLMQMKQQIAQGQQQQPNPAVQRNQIDMMKLQQQAKQDDVKNQLAASQQQIDVMGEQTARMKILAEEQQDQRDALLRMAELETQKMAKEVELSVATVHEAHQQHSDHRGHDREDLRLMHDVHQANKPQPEAKDARIPAQ